MTAKKRLAEIEMALRGRQLVYFGTRGADAEPLLNLSNMAFVFSLIAPLDACSVREVSLEVETGERVELDSYNLDFDRREVIGDLRRRLLHLFDRPSAVLPYRPCAFLSSAWFPRSDRTLYLGMFHESQACFEHKPWVESQLSRFGVRVLPWRYWADSDRRLIGEWAAKEPLVLRANHTDGGAGVRLLRDAGALDTEWPMHGDGFLAAAPYLEHSIPLNVNACVFSDGRVTLHGPSLQIIGIPSLTRRAFGYCGNDFARTADLEPRVLDSLEEMSVRTGMWLHQNGYRGAFGIDALLHDGILYLTEVNPRFQGSSLHSARLDATLGRADVFLEHAAALLGFAARASRPLRELAREQPAVSHLILHNTLDVPVRVESETDASRNAQLRLVPAPAILVQSEAIAFEVVVPRSVTGDGTSLTPEACAIVSAELGRLHPVTKADPSGTDSATRDLS
ncbi:MAG: ATP-grasp domain-containing protein [Acidobacteria bacterium]|nr:ATP-grasp domain-containing protein [Acidobacteriota bacterium]